MRRNCLFILVFQWLSFTTDLEARAVIVEGSESEWKYRATESAPPAGWNLPEFDDKEWAGGGAPLGYGETRLTTSIKLGTADSPPNVALFRKSFTFPKVEQHERVVISLCVDDGAVVFINGQEVMRQNLPDGPLEPATKALRQLSESEEGFYRRWTIPAKLLRLDALNVIAVQVHQAGTSSGDLFFDLALRTVTPREANPKVSDAAKAVIDAYYKGQFVPPGMTIPDGYIDGGRNMKFDAEGRASSNREIITVDRGKDPEMQRHLAFARSAALQQLTPRERAVRIAVYVDKIATPPGGSRWTEESITQLTEEFTNQPVLMGEILEHCRSGVCRHRGLLYKILADEAGLKAALVRGNLRNRSYPAGYPHAWNEIHLEDGVRLLVDSSFRAGKWDFPDVNTPFVVEEYRKLDNSPLYGSEAKKAVPAQPEQ